MPQRIVFPEKGKVVLESFHLPSLGPGDVQVRTLYSLMSIGTETIILHQRYDPDTHFAKIFSFPQRKTGVQVGPLSMEIDVIETGRSNETSMNECISPLSQ